MAARFCVECGNLVTTAFCPSCGAIQPSGEGTPWPASDPTAAAGSAGPVTGNPAGSGEPAGQSTPAPGQSGTPTATPAAQSQQPPTGAWSELIQPSAGDAAPPTQAFRQEGQFADGGPGQPWHPFEQPTWYPESADPRALADPTMRVNVPQRDQQGDFMGVSNWQTNPPPTDRKHTWILGALAAAAVVAVLVAVAFFVIRGQGSDSATPDGTGRATISPTTSASQGTAPTEPLKTEPGPPVTVTVTSETTADTSATDSSASAAPVAPNPMGGPDRDIACSPGYVVQVASAGNDADFAARVAELRGANQLPPEVFVARTATSCPIFSTQTNSVVLYAGPFIGEYDGCAARLAGAPDSFIKGTTPETAKQYVSCLCPQTASSVPPITAVGQTGVWVGELQRILANKLNYKIADLGPPTWGVYTQSTADAVTKFQTDQSLPGNGQVDAGTWLKLQAAQC